VSDAELTLAVILVFAIVENASGHRAPGLFGYPESGILNMKFDPCGGEAVVAERPSETLGSMSFRLHQAQYDNRSKRAYVEFRRSNSDGGRGIESDVLGLIAAGRSNKEIARILSIAPETVKTHVKHIFIKLNVEKRAQAVPRDDGRRLTLRYSVSSSPTYSRSSRIPLFDAPPDPPIGGWRERARCTHISAQKEFF